MTATDLLEKALAKANAEGRNNAGLWLACQLRDARLDRAEAEAVMRDYAAAVPQHAVSYTHLRAHETVLDLVCRLLLDKKQRMFIPYLPLLPSLIFPSSVYLY